MYLKENDIQLIRNYFVDKPVLKAYLFGSYSRKEADNNSDIDILVDLDYSRHIGLGFVQMKLDFVTCSPYPNPIFSRSLY